MIFGALSKCKFFEYCDNNIGLYSIAPHLVIAFNLFVSFFLSVCMLVLGFFSVLHPYMYVVISLPTIATAIVIGLNGNDEK